MINKKNSRKTPFQRLVIVLLPVIVCILGLIGILQWKSTKTDLLSRHQSETDRDAILYNASEMKYTLASTCASGAVQPAGYLQSYPYKPLFRSDHTLPRLSHFGWPLSAEAVIEFGTNWGYALEIGSANSATIINMDDPTKYEGKIMAKVKEDPRKYPLQVHIDRFILSDENYPDAAWVHDSNGRLIYGVDGKKIFSPEAPVVFLRQLGEQKADYLRQIAQKANVAIVLNGGETDLSVPARIYPVLNDPKIQASMGTKSFDQYISERKAYQESFMTDAARSAAPGRQLYIYYFASGGATRNYGQASQWSWAYDKMQTITDLPNESMYWGQFNSGFVKESDNRQNDMLTQVLNAVGRQIELGQPLSYNWVNDGWWKESSNDGLGDLSKYLGFLKMYYMAGNVGSIAGYFDYPSAAKEGYDGFDSCFDPAVPFDFSKRTLSQPNSLPHWLTQMVELSQVHALFSWLEPFVRNGDLVAGPNSNYFSTDQPAYELPTGYLDTRVIARKMKNADKWIVAAWAADGTARDVNVDVPGLGAVSLNAVSAGHVYFVTPANRTTPTLVDVDANYPSANAKTLWDNGTLPHS